MEITTEDLHPLKFHRDIFLDILATLISDVEEPVPAFGLNKVADVVIVFEVSAVVFDVELAFRDRNQVLSDVFQCLMENRHAIFV